MAKRKKRDDRIGKVAAKGPKPLAVNSSVREAGEQMRALKAEKFPVVAGDKVVGTVEGKFPERKAAGYGHDPAASRVGESMSKGKFFCFENQTVEEARKIMRDNGLKHLPVVDGDFHIVGMVSLKKL